MLEKIDKNDIKNNNKIYEDEHDDVSFENTNDILYAEVIKSLFHSCSRDSILFKLISGYLAFWLICGGIIFSKDIKDITYHRNNLYRGTELIISDDKLEQIISNIEEEFEMDIPDYQYDDYALLNSILENKNLTDEEKQIFSSISKMIEDNPYLDKEEAYNSLLQVKVCYTERPERVDPNTWGEYYYRLKKIFIYQEDEDYGVLKHEIIHCVYHNDTTSQLPNYFREGMTELLCNEYFSSDPYVEFNSYPFEILMVKMLCEVSSADTVLKAFSTGNMDIIAKEITQNTTFYTEESVNSVLSSIERLMDLCNEQDKDLNQIDNYMMIVFSCFEDVMSSKTEDDDRQQAFDYYRKMFINVLDDNPIDAYAQDVSDTGVLEKAYFSSELKNNYKMNQPVKVKLKVKSLEE